jgi:hypothetical protein
VAVWEAFHTPDKLPDMRDATCQLRSLTGVEPASAAKRVDAMLARWHWVSWGGEAHGEKGIWDLPRKEMLDQETD